MNEMHDPKENRDRYSLRGRVYESIREDILSGKYEQNTELKETAIGTELGVSRTPVREALRQLELEGLVTIIPNRGAYVNAITAKDVKDIYNIRSTLEGLCARWAAEQVTKEQLESYGLTARLEALIRTVSSELTDKAPFYQDVVTSSIQTFWALLKRFHPRADADQLPDGRRSRMLSELQELLAYIDVHYADNISLEYAAGRMNFSPSHFSKTFKKLMGINFVTYLNMVRVEQAAQELRHTEKKFTDVALSCGFNNIRTFNRVFKEITGCTPSEFLALPDPDLYKRTYYNRRSEEKEYVRDDSMTLVKNFQ